MSDFTPYEIWLVQTTAGDEKEFPLVQFTGAIGLSDDDAIALAVQRLQDVIDKINESAMNIEVRNTTVIYPPAINIRLARQEEDLAS